jgi:hypothetical protein
MKNFRFHASGSSSVKWISAPITPLTLQWAARMAPLVAAGTATASVILTSGIFKPTTSAHAMCVPSAAWTATVNPANAAIAHATPPASATPVTSRFIGASL